jgi:hypothetical protein
MTIRRYEEIICDRCGWVFEKKGRTTEIGWWTLTNGSGSRTTEPDRRSPDLDKDLCQSCTEEFDEWWAAKHCQYTHPHTREFCGNQMCRES